MTKEEEINYWAVDTSLKCFEGQHSLLVIWILLFVGVVYGGLLIVFICILASAEKPLGRLDTWVYRTTGFLYRSYGSERRCYWEVAIVMRKAIIAFLVFCANRFDTLVFITCLATFILLAMGLQIVVMPYREDFGALNRIDLSALFVSVLTIMMAIILESEGFMAEWLRLTLSLACLGLNISAFLLLFRFLVIDWAECIKLSLDEGTASIDADAGTLKILMIWLNCKLQSLTDFMRCGRSHHDQTNTASAV